MQKRKYTLFPINEVSNSSYNNQAGIKKDYALMNESEVLCDEAGCEVEFSMD